MGFLVIGSNSLLGRNKASETKSGSLLIGEQWAAGRTVWIPGGGTRSRNGAHLFDLVYALQIGGMYKLKKKCIYIT
ncbi:hypothetical protein XELAEV_18000409mg [Xenopus laevis]|uniref:Uncharacterized protein n=1 Tax=Xenopus laevis TaxID=8355 RepID=A0A974BNZ5_XENLA|nr:hypothetical protein XELAEV_18000409mg [Xenopus laevis]